MSLTETRETLNSCANCGSRVSEHALACPVCQALLGQRGNGTKGAVEKSPATATPQKEDTSAAQAAASERPAWPAEPPRAPEPEWRREVADRLEAYRSRRHHDESQSRLTFSPESPGVAAAEIDRASPEYRASLRRGRHVDPAPFNHREPPAVTEKIEIVAVEPPPEFTEPEEDSWHPDREVERLVPVAGLDERWSAGLYDAACLALAFAVFLVLFGTLGGRISLARPDAAVSGAVFVLLYGLYFALFTGLGGATPGLDARGLSIVSFDGAAASRAQLMWRSFGYLVSAGTLMLGFLWALWDEDQLTWHDRISQTYVTAAAPVSNATSATFADAGSPT